jgi:hypothetical protein
MSGGCHCGNISVVLESELAPDQMAVRRCQCSFCGKHGVRTVTDPKGRVKITVGAADELIRYRFGLKTADYLVCGRCGVYVAAVLAEQGSSYATVNINTFESPALFTEPPALVSYDGETETDRRTRRRGTWTPAVLLI